MFNNIIMSNITKSQTTQYIADTIRLRVEKDPTFARGPGFKKMCQLFGLYEFIAEKRHQFITVALPNSYNLETLKKNLTHSTHKWLTGAMARVEYHSATGENLHIHILVDGIKNKTRVIRDMSRKWKVEKNFIHVLHGTEPEDYNHRLAYIQGQKENEQKCQYVLKDSAWRIENSIKPVYIL